MPKSRDPIKGAANRNCAGSVVIMPNVDIIPIVVVIAITFNSQ